MKVKKKDEEELQERLSNLTLNDGWEDVKVKKDQKDKKISSFLNDSSDSDEDYIPKQKRSKKKSLKKEKITPQKKIIYNSLTNKSTNKKSKSKV